MGYGNSGSNLATTFFKVESLKKNAKELYFKGSVKQDEIYVDIEDKPTQLFGVVKGIQANKYTYEGKINNTVKIILDDDDSRVVLEMGYSNMLVGLLNTLLGAEVINDLKLSLYINKKKYKSMWIEIDDVDPKTNQWKFDHAKVITPLITKTDLPGGDVHIDKSKLEEFLIEQINAEEFQSKIINKFTENSDNSGKDVDAADTNNSVDSDGNGTEEEPDDLPF